MDRTVQANAVITLNMEPAREKVKEFGDLLAEARRKLDELNKKPIELRTDAENKRIKELEKEVAKLEKQFGKAQQNLKNFRDTLQHLDKASINDLTNAKKALNEQIRRLTPGTKEYIAATEDFKKVNQRLTVLTSTYRQVDTAQRGFFGLLKSGFGWFNKYWGGLTMLSGFLTGISTSFRKCAEDAARLDDVYADVMKTTGLLHDEVAALDRELMKIDTRTSREQLLLLARDAGKLGIQGKEDILGFVRAADQIQVALGEDLGEGAIRNLGKIADVLGYTKSMGVEKSLLSIASAINAVGQDSTASEAYLVEFTQRLAGVGAQAGISAANLIGFASGLDQSAMKVEMASTAFQKFLMKMYEDPAQFAAYAKMEVEEFADLLKNDANTAIVTVLKSLKDNDGFGALVPIFKDMGLDGARAVTVLSAMATNIDAVTKAQALANDEFSKATSVTEEYNTKNNNLQAQLEKARKQFKNASIALGQSLNPVMLKSTNLVTYLIKALVTYGKEIKTALIAIAALTTAIKLGAIAHAAFNTAVKVGTALQSTWTVVTKAASYAINLLRGRTVAATKAYLAMNAAMSASVFGVLAVAVSGLAIWVGHLAQKHREAAEAAQWEQKLEEKATETYAEEAAHVSTLTRILESNNVSLESRRKALEELKRIVPGYHADLTEEGILINNNKEALMSYTDALKKAARIKVRREDIEEREAELMRLEDLLEKAKEREAKAIVNFEGKDRFEVEGDLITESDEYTELSKATKARAKLEKEIEELGKLQEEAVAKFDAIAGTVPQAAAETANALTEATVEAVETANEILTQAQFQLLEDRYSQLTKKEREMIDKGYQSLSEEESEALKSRYDKIMAEERKLDDQRYREAVNSLNKQQREELNAINRAYFNGEITAEEHGRKLNEITLKYLEAKKQLALDNGKDTSVIEEAVIREQAKQKKAAYDEEIKLLENEQKHEEGLLALSLSKQEITQKEYDSRKLALKAEYLQKELDIVGKYGYDETSTLQKILDTQLEAQRAANEEMARLKEEAKKVIDGLLSPSDLRDAEMQSQLERLDVLHQAMLLSEQQYEEAVKQLRTKYADEDLKEKLANVQKYVDKVSSIMSEASNFVTALKDAESARLESQYQADLTAAGDNAERREQIEAEYEKKKLELQKKYADTEMVINIAKTIAAGALAAIQAFAQLGPVGGAISAALIATTTAAEVATIVQQRNAIRNSSVNGGGGTTDTSSLKTGTRTIAGYYSGGYTEKSPDDNKVVDVVHANEWVAPAWLVRRYPYIFTKLERYRKEGSFGSHGSQRRGFAEGGFTSNIGQNSASAASDTAFYNKLEEALYSAIRHAIDEGSIRAHVVYQDIVNKKNQLDYFYSQTSRK